MFRKSLVVCLTLSALAVSSTAFAQSRTYSQALNAYFAGDHEIAEALLTVAIGDGSGDARQYYFRGLARLGNGQPDEAAADFTFAAELEASGLSRGGDANRALEKVQGSARRTVEKYRREARRTAAIEAGYQKKAKALDGMYTEARGAYFAGDYQRAGLLLDQIIKHETQDPRVYYYRGLCLEQLKRHEDAAEDFAAAVQLELSPGNRINVDVALEKVQGDIRIALESHRHELLSTLRRQKRIEQQQLIAKLVQSRLGSVGASAVSTAPSPGTVASTSPMPSPGPGAVTPPPAAGTTTPTPATTPAPTTTVNVARGPAIDLAWIPSDAELLVHVRVFDAWNSELLTPFHDNEDVQSTFAMMKAATGLTVADIESVTAGVNDVTQLAQMAAVAGPAALENPADKLVAVVRLRLPFDTQFLDAQAELFEKANHSSKSYYRALDEGETPCIYMPNLKTLVLADEAVLTELIDRGPDAAPRPELAFVDATNQIVIAFVPSDPTGLTDQIPEESTGSPGGDALLAAIKGQLHGFSLGFGLTDSFTLEIRLLGADAAAAGAMGTALGQVAQELAGMWQFTKALAPEPVQPIVDSLLRSLKTSSQGDVAIVSTRLSAQSVQRAVAEVEEMIPMLLAGGLMAAAGGGPPGLGPGDLNDFGIPKPDPPMATRPAMPVQITTKALISEEPDFDNQGNEQPKAIELVLDIVGDDAKAANAWGFPMLTAAKDNNGTDLTLRDRSLFASGAGFFQIDHDDFRVEHPEDGCQVAIAFDPPANMADSIASADGMLKLRVLADSESFEVADAASFIGKKLTDSKLTGAGFMLSMSEGEEDLGGGFKFKFWKLNWDNPDSKLIDQMADGGGLGLQAPQLVDAAGDVLQTFDGVESVSFGANSSFAWSMTLDDDNPPPADAKLRFTLNKKVDYIDVKFSVQDVEISAAASN